VERNPDGRGRRNRWATAIVLASILHLLPGCAGTANPYAGQNPTWPVWLVAPGWHTGLVVRRADIPKDLVPESADFPRSTYLEFGWGDRDYYQSREDSVWLALKAALVPSPSVMHVAGFDEPPGRYFDAETTLRIDLPEPAFRNLLAYLHHSFDRRGASRAPPLGLGLYGDSRFYEARGQFHLFENCNVWTARALKAAGLPAIPAEAVTAGNLRCQARHWGTVEAVTR
jgi:uncharacterized protein (TIGR02117 family)